DAVFGLEPDHHPLLGGVFIQHQGEPLGDLHFAADHDVEGVSRIAFLDDDLAGGESPGVGAAQNLFKFLVFQVLEKKDFPEKSRVLNTRHHNSGCWRAMTTANCWGPRMVSPGGLTWYSNLVRPRRWVILVSANLRRMKSSMGEGSSASRSSRLRVRA